MKLIPCPDLGPRPRNEFDYGGEVRRPPLDADDKCWAEYVYNRSGQPGVLREWWYHRPTGNWYVFERDTQRDEFLISIPLKEVQYALPSDETTA
ncbi:MAG: sarcosine oxidase subunit delta [Gammaproteobacteria bacterium]